MQAALKFIKLEKILITIFTNVYLSPGYCSLLQPGK